MSRKHAESAILRKSNGECRWFQDRRRGEWSTIFRIVTTCFCRTCTSRKRMPTLIVRKMMSSTWVLTLHRKMIPIISGSSGETKQSNERTSTQIEPLSVRLTFYLLPGTSTPYCEADALNASTRTVVPRLYGVVMCIYETCRFNVQP